MSENAELKVIHEPRSVLVTGTNRGIGLGFVKKLTEFPNIRHIFAACRDPENAQELKKIADPRIQIIQLDVTNDVSIDSAVDNISKIVGSDGLTMLVNNAGILIPYEFTSEVSREKIIEQYNLNSASPLIMIQKFLPLLEKSANLENGDQLSTSRAAIVNISSTSGSIQMIDGSFNGPLVLYRMSKSAMNSFAKSFSIEMRKTNILIASFCPGWVQTDMGGGNAELSVETACNILVPNALRLDAGNHGQFIDRHLKVIPH
ncbi:unnamed protein product [Caenorhabditis angaria]|uniref:Uncharacterized protein n=1 Tax=Caenorhabditis angaria TaxID=860376 RepID=A0A9P1IS87_9PELO|nr:unnamed protein product [Caenorhabditis angaria]